MNFYEFKITRYSVTCTVWKMFSIKLLIECLVVASPYYWTKFSDKWLTELNYPPTHQHHIYFSFAKSMTFYIFAVLLTTSSYPRLLLDPLTIQPVPSSINSTIIPLINCPFLCNTITYAILRVLFLSHLHNTFPYAILMIKLSSSIHLALHCFLF